LKPSELTLYTRFDKWKMEKGGEGQDRAEKEKETV